MTLRAVGTTAQLCVSDTGGGIPESELPRLFERFHRVVGTTSRSHEGSGIGLALVEELVHLHGGSVSADSRLGEGTTLRVLLPFGREHLDPARIVADAQAVAHVSVAEQYLADVDSTIIRARAEGPAPGPQSTGDRRRILFADDNGDLREYVARILAPRHQVVAVRNGREALAALRGERFDLIVSDVMMPDVDGFALLEAIRADRSQAAIPFIFLSARAGEAAAIEGLVRGADDYLIKPFSSEELVARVAAHLNAASIRDKAVREREFLSDAGRILAQSLDLQTTLQNVAQLTIPQFADWCQVDLRTADGRLRTVAIAHRDPRKHEVAQQFVGRVHLNPDPGAGQPSATISDAGADTGGLYLHGELGLRSAARIPLVAQGRTLGAIGAVYSDSQRRYTGDDLPMLEELGRRAGLAVHNATEFERERRVAESFQAASLPSALPHVHGLAFDAVYVPAGDEGQVGGDWYDAVRLFDGRVVISIGDVTGHGLRAAVTMGNMRQTIRGIAQVHADPALMLDAADRALRLEHPDQIVTAFVGVFDPIAATFSYASAGHPPPLLRDADGRVELLSDGGLPLGLRDNGDQSGGKTIAVPRPAHLVFYTDGLTESRHAPADGEERLKQLVGAGSVLAAERPADALRAAFLDGRPAADDVAILVVSIGGEVGFQAHEDAFVQRWTFDAADGAAGQAVRREVARGLSLRGATPDSIHAAEVVVGELLGNANRHAGGAVDVVVDWSGSAPVLHVLDSGSGFHHIPTLPKNVYSESGRGLFLISRLSNDFAVTKRLTGGSHARAVLSRRRLTHPGKMV